MADNHNEKKILNQSAGEDDTPDESIFIDESGESEKERKDIVSKIFEYIKEGNTFKAYDAALIAKEKFKDDIAIDQAIALSLLRTGSVTEAKKIAKPIYEKLSNYLPEYITEDILKLIEYLAMTYKESWQYSKQRVDLEIARDLYKLLYQTKKDSEYIISTAMLSWMIGDDAECKKMSLEVISINKDRDFSKMNYMEFSQLGLSMLLLGDIQNAIGYYRKSIEGIDNHYKKISDIRSNLIFLQKGQFVIPKELFDILKPPVIAAFSGHQIDIEDTIDKVFPFQFESYVKQEISNYIDQMDIQIGYCSASCGSDLIFIETMIEKGREVNIILPFMEDDFLDNNVRYVGPIWEGRFKKIITNVNSIIYATRDYYLGHDSLYDFAHKMIHGSAIMRADFLDGKAHMIALWDLKPFSKVANFIDEWHDIETLHVVDLENIIEKIKHDSKDKTVKEIKTRPLVPRIKDMNYADHHRKIRFMLFSDFAGYSKLKDEHMPEFLIFLKSLEEEIMEWDLKPESLNTWGDALFAVMGDVILMAEYALKFRDLVERLGARMHNTPIKVNARISLHAGPVYLARDPFLKKQNYYGSHINRTARLEPVTVVGQVYATEQFVTLLNTKQKERKIRLKQEDKPVPRGFITEYVGHIEFAKNFGKEPVYHIRWEDS